MNPQTAAPRQAPVTARHPELASEIVLVNGIPASGKTLISPIVAAFDRMEVEKYDFPLERILQGHHLGKVDRNLTETMIRLFTDLDIYQLMMSREANFRFKDLSCVFRHHNWFAYVRRLFQEGDWAVEARVKKERPILCLVTHNLLSVGSPLFTALGDRLRIVESVRHPLYMLKQIRMFMPRACVDDPRDFNLNLEFEGRQVPWYALGWEEKFLRSGPMDRTIYLIDRLLTLSAGVMEGLTPEQRSRVLYTPFEPFALNTEPWIAKLETFMRTKAVASTRREMRKQNVPRRFIADGINLQVYRENGWVPPVKQDELYEFKLRWDHAASEASPDALEVLAKRCREYEEKYFAGTGIPLFRP